MEISKEHNLLSEAMNILSKAPISQHRMYAREFVAKALIELEAEHFKAVKAKQAD